MKAYLVKTPKLVQRTFPKRVWAFPNKEKHVFLTFDDGPIPEVTPWVLSLLKQYDAKATFFCIGDNVAKYPEVFQQIKSEDHAIGNHTFHHLNGRKTTTVDYLSNTQKAAEVLSDVDGEKLFRPPFGKMSSKQAKALQQKNYKIIMWDVLSADFDHTISEEQCLQNVLDNIEVGSIVVFHDSLKAEKKLRYALPKVLDYISEKGWICETIT